MAMKPDKTSPARTEDGETGRFCKGRTRQAGVGRQRGPALLLRQRGGSASLFSTDHAADSKMGAMFLGHTWMTYALAD